MTEQGIQARLEDVAGDAEVVVDLLEAVEAETDVPQHQQCPPLADDRQGPGQRAGPGSEVGLVHCSMLLTAATVLRSMLLLTSWASGGRAGALVTAAGTGPAGKCPTCSSQKGPGRLSGPRQRGGARKAAWRGPRPPRGPLSSKQAHRACTLRQAKCEPADRCRRATSRFRRAGTRACQRTLRTRPLTPGRVQTRAFVFGT